MDTECAIYNFDVHSLCLFFPVAFFKNILYIYYIMDKIKSIHIIFKENELYETFIIDSENKKIEEPITSEINIEYACTTINEQTRYIVNDKHIVTVQFS